MKRSGPQGNGHVFVFPLLRVLGALRATGPSSHDSGFSADPEGWPVVEGPFLPERGSFMPR
eukprot:7607753-Pyramimonas_sp.AAC.1